MITHWIKRLWSATFDLSRTSGQLTDDKAEELMSQMVTRHCKWNVVSIAQHFLATYFPRFERRLAVCCMLRSKLTAHADVLPDHLPTETVCKWLTVPLSAYVVSSHKFCTEHIYGKQTDLIKKDQWFAMTLFLVPQKHWFSPMNAKVLLLQFFNNELKPLGQKEKHETPLIFGVFSPFNRNKSDKKQTLLQTGGVNGQKLGQTAFRNPVQINKLSWTSVSVFSQRSCRLEQCFI